MLTEAYNNMDSYNNKNTAIFDDINFDTDGLLDDIGFALDLNDHDDIISTYGFSLKSRDIDSDEYALFFPSPTEVYNSDDENGSGLIGSSSVPSHAPSNHQESTNQSQHSETLASETSSGNSSSKSNNLNQSSRNRRVFTFENVPDIIESTQIDSYIIPPPTSSNSTISSTRSSVPMAPNLNHHRKQLSPLSCTHKDLFYIQNNATCLDTNYLEADGVVIHQMSMTPMTTTSCHSGFSSYTNHSSQSSESTHYNSKVNLSISTTAQPAKLNSYLEYSPCSMLMSPSEQQLLLQSQEQDDEFSMAMYLIQNGIFCSPATTPISPPHKQPRGTALSSSNNKRNANKIKQQQQLMQTQQEQQQQQQPSDDRSVTSNSTGEDSSVRSKLNIEKRLSEAQAAANNILSSSKDGIAGIASRSDKTSSTAATVTVTSTDAVGNGTKKRGPYKPRKNAKNTGNNNNENHVHFDLPASPTDAESSPSPVVVAVAAAAVTVTAVSTAVPPLPTPGAKPARAATSKTKSKVSTTASSSITPPLPQPSNPNQNANVNSNDAPKVITSLLAPLVGTQRCVSDNYQFSIHIPHISVNDNDTSAPSPCISITSTSTGRSRNGSDVNVTAFESLSLISDSGVASSGFNGIPSVGNHPLSLVGDTRRLSSPSVDLPQQYLLPDAGAASSAMPYSAPMNFSLPSLSSLGFKMNAGNKTIDNDVPVGDGSSSSSSSGGSSTGLTARSSLMSISDSAVGKQSITGSSHEINGPMLNSGFLLSSTFLTTLNGGGNSSKVSTYCGSGKGNVSTSSKNNTTKSSISTATTGKAAVSMKSKPLSPIVPLHVSGNEGADLLAAAKASSTSLPFPSFHSIKGADYGSTAALYYQDIDALLLENKR